MRLDIGTVGIPQCKLTRSPKTLRNAKRNAPSNGVSAGASCPSRTKQDSALD
jgi:hypothetical protein